MGSSRSSSCCSRTNGKGISTSRRGSSISSWSSSTSSTRSRGSSISSGRNSRSNGVVVKVVEVVAILMVSSSLIVVCTSCKLGYCVN